ncbi:universal stress protein, partial [Streptomyces sp. NPDC091259]|uniref:universal stress protein n=1 Tax=Streptomyces sp. NPDC091259 TaxID=3365976 RepID=UPI003821822D
VTAEHPGMNVTTEFDRSDPVTSLHRAAGLQGTIVVGNRGLGGFGALMLGSVGLKAAAGAKTPLVVVRGPEDRAEAGVVVAAVRDERDLASATYAAREAELWKASLRLLHVRNILHSVGHVATRPDDIGGIGGEQVEELQAVADRIRDGHPGLTVYADAKSGVSVPGVLVDASHHADLLVVGGSSSFGYIGPALGRVAHGLVHHAHCPVLLVPRRGPEPGAGHDGEERRGP